MVLDSRATCKLKGKKGEDPKTATYECEGCGHTCKGFIAWRNHMKKRTKFLKCAPPPQPGAESRSMPP